MASLPALSFYYTVMFVLWFWLLNWCVSALQDFLYVCCFHWEVGGGQYVRGHLNESLQLVAPVKRLSRSKSKIWP